jgi:outer membrane protein assembly factor BamB
MFRVCIRTLALTVLLLFAVAAEPGPNDWPQFLGPRRDSVSSETGLNWQWKTNPPKVLWKVPLGSAFSSLTVVGDRLYTMTRRGKRDLVVCLDTAKGKELWSYDAAPSYIDRQRQGSGPRSTPTYDKGKLYCLLPMGDLVCLTEQGKHVWTRNTFKETGAVNPMNTDNNFYYWGVSLSPLVVGNQLIVQPGGKKNNSVAAFDKNNGKLLWSAGNDPPGYASPILISVAGQKQIVCPTGQSILGLDPVKGRVLWRYAFGNEFSATGATPVWKDNLLFVSAAYGAGSAVLELEHKESKWAAREKWKSKKDLQNLFATSPVLGGHIYGCHGDLRAFFLRCLDLQTGKVKWEERLDERWTYLAVDNHLLAWSEKGTLQLLEATPQKYHCKAELPNLLTSKSWAAPALANGRLYLRDQKHVLCLDLRAR